MSDDAGRDGAAATPAPGAVTVVRLGSLRRTVAATAVGNMIEWYDFGVFSFSAVTIGQVFFPEASRSAQLISALATFAAAFVVRPLGGIFFGPLSDRIGRKRVLVLTVITMAFGTFAVGLLPGYAQIGVWAPVLLLVARLIQGFSTGGEYGSAMTFIAEHSPDRRRGFVASWLEFGTLAGFVLGAALVTVLTTVLSSGALDSWGWRIPFLVAGPLGLVGLYLRLRLAETPAFEHLENRAPARPTGLRKEVADLARNQRRPVLICLGLVLVLNVNSYILTAYMPNYLSAQLGFSQTRSLVVVLVVLAILMVLLQFAGRLSDRIGRRPVMMTGCVLLVALSVPAFLIIQQRTLAAVLVGTLLIGLMYLCFDSTEPGTLPTLFPTPVRAGALSITYNVSTSLFGGTTPVIAATLVDATGSLLAPGFLLAAAGLLGGIAVYLAPETARRPMPAAPPVAVSEQEAAAIRHGSPAS
ncbi:MFS transporter [Phytohabitans sp. ZYX-F-186]|uniref:MFS transporter n=1 Tax=Phytohabitans maris TaxID=3071409 RepID=A0ABU0ZPI3_9ACTN|nr:MFS transporter [Phytohabitans sp. ZYX-F-186]MDQ7908312.1 MFS transporter [Phytohabitans sp. ZYX-F-186]